MKVTVKPEHFDAHDTWENDWYRCPNCDYNSLDIGFNYCPPICGEPLTWEI